MRRLAAETNCALAVSLHAPNDALRDELVPINRKHPIAELLDACWHYVEKQNARSITFEYVMLDGINDQPEHAYELVRLLKGKPAKLNLIPFNPFPQTRYRRSTPAVQRVCPAGSSSCTPPGCCPWPGLSAAPAAVPASGCPASPRLAAPCPSMFSSASVS